MKLSSIICSAALALALLIPAPAAAQQLVKRSSPGAAAARQRVADMPAPLKKAFHEAGKRPVADTAPSLRRAMNVAGVHRKAAPRKVMAASAALPELCGMVTYQDGWTTTASRRPGVYKIFNDGSDEMLFAGPDGLGGTPAGGYYYVSSYENYYGTIFIDTFVYDMSTGLLHKSGTDMDGNYEKIIFDFATDPTDGTIYGLGYSHDAQSMQLSRVDCDPDAGFTVTAIGTLPGNWNSIACGPDGQLYGISYTGVISGNSFTATGSTLHKINKATAAATKVGDTGYAPQYFSSATIDPRSGKMYWTVCPPDNTGLLCEVNLTTGAATELLQFALNDEVQGLYVAAPEAEDGAPAAVEDVEAVFDGGSLSGHINFTAPTTTFDGQPATGTISYTVTAGDTQLATGTTQFGAAVSAPVTLAASGEYVFSVTTANAAGSGPAVQLKQFVGYGTPRTPVATLEYTNGSMNLTWTPVTASADGGYLDPEAVTYTVVRYPGAAEVYEGSATSFSEPVAEPESLTKYYYTVVATAHGVSSAPATSNTISLGAGIVPPYINTFDNEGSLEGYTIIDGNADNKKWMWADNKGNGEVRMAWNSDKAMDDWLITPPVKLQGGKLYSVGFKAHASGSAYAERVEARWGTDATPAAMTLDLVAPTDLKDADPVTLGNLIVPAADGLYYFGIHGISDPDKFYLYIDDFEVGAPRPATIPAAPGNFKVVPATNGDLRATITFTAPILDMAGHPLQALDKVDLLRDGTVIKTWTAPATGAALSYTDEPAEGGDVTYSAVAYNADGAGAEASASVFIGIGKPAAPTGVQLSEEGNTGYVTLTWDAVTTTLDGTAIDPSRVTYDVCVEGYYDWEPVAEGLTTTTFSAQAVPEGRQDFVQYAVFAVTEGGSTFAVSQMIAAGTPYEGMEESFANGSLDKYIWALGYNDGAEWDLYEDDYLDIPASDLDNGYAAMRYSAAPGKASLISGKIALPQKSAGVSFHALVMTAGEEYNHNEIQLYVKEPADISWTKLGEPFVMCEMGEPNTWAQGTASLQPYAGKVVQLRFEGITVDYTYTFMDRILAGSLAERDLAITGVSAPAEVACGNPYTIEAGVANLGTAAATDFTVKLLEGGDVVDEHTVASLASGENTIARFELTMSPFATTHTHYTVQIDYPVDEDPDNNSYEVIIEPRVSNLPRVDDLDAEATAGGVALAWSEPDLTDVVVEPELTDFEDGVSFAQEYDGWTFVDVDGSPIGGLFTNAEVPGTTAEVTPAGFILYSYSLLPASGIEPHSGDKFLVSIYRADDGMVDDWAISPELTGEAQTVTFWARSANGVYAEKIEMYYSTGSLDPAQFKKVDGVESVPAAWTMYSFDVPEGARHFAVRSCATGALMLMLDDFTFAAAGTSADLSIVGYDVYRDGEKITAEPVAECEYLDAEAPDGELSYCVITVYTTGTSAPSNIAVIEYDGISDTAAPAVGITAGRGTVTVTGAEGRQLTVAAADGRVYFNGTAAARHTVAVPAGICVVKAGDTIAKVAVR